MFIEYENGVFVKGDCIDVMKTIPDNYFDMILCDLPYGATQNKWDSIIPFVDLWKQYNRIAKDEAAIVLTAQTPFDKALGASNLEMLKYEWIWQKPNGTGHLNSKKMPMKNHENVLIFYRKLPVYNPQMREGEPYRCKSGKASCNYGEQVRVVTENSGERYPLSVIGFNTQKGLHPTQKPIELFEYLIKTYTNEGQRILDNCAGSGTTAIAAINTKRKWVCIEKDDVYFEKANERIKQHSESKCPPQKPA